MAREGDRPRKSAYEWDRARWKREQPVRGVAARVKAYLETRPELADWLTKARGEPRARLLARDDLDLSRRCHWSVSITRRQIEHLLIRAAQFDVPVSRLVRDAFNLYLDALTAQVGAVPGKVEGLTEWVHVKEYQRRMNEQAEAAADE